MCATRYSYAYAAREGVTGDGSISLVLNKPDLSTAPQVVFTTNPRVKRG